MRWQQTSILIIAIGMMLGMLPQFSNHSSGAQTNFSSTEPTDIQFEQAKTDYKYFQSLSGNLKNIWFKSGSVSTKSLVASSKIRYSEFKRSATDKNKNIERLKSLKKTAISSGISGLQTYLVIISCALIEVIKAEHAKASIDMRLWSLADTTKETGVAIREIIDSNTMMAGLAGSSIFSLFADPLLNKMFSTPQATFRSTIFQSILSQLTHMFLSFGVFEISSELVREASDRLSEYFDTNDPIVRDMLKDQNHIITQIILTLRKGDNEADKKKSEIAGRMFNQIFVNMAQILNNENNYFVVWLYNALRHRIMTGNFLSLIASLTAANSVGGLLVESPTFKWILLFNMVGATGASITPEETKYSATDLFQKARLLFNDVYQNGRQLQYQWTKTSAAPADTDENLRLDTYHWIKARRAYRERKVDIFVERIYYYYNNLQNKKDMYDRIIKLGDADQKPELIDELDKIQSENEKYFEQFVTAFLAIVSIYESEAHMLSDYKNKGGYDADNLSTEIHNMESLFRQYCEVYERFMTLNFYSLNGSKPLPSSTVGSINDKCKVTPVARTTNPERLNKEEQTNLTASVSFLELYYGLGVDELRIILDRNSEIRRILAESLSSIEL